MFEIEKEEYKKEYPITDMVEQLLTLTEDEWGLYSFYHEPLERKFTKEQKIEYIHSAIRCGKEEGKKLKEQHPQMELENIIKILGIKLEKSNVPTGGERVLFAQYTEPDEIVIYRNCIDKVQNDVKEIEKKQLLSNIPIEQILIAHELFHGIEYQKRKEIYTQTEKIELWRKPFSNKSKIVCLSEIAAMAFAKEVLDLPFSPYLLDVLLLYGYDKKVASALYDEILEIIAE